MSTAVRTNTTPEGWQQVKYAYRGRMVRTQRMNLEIYALRETSGANARLFSNIKNTVTWTATRLFDTKYVFHFRVPLPLDTFCLRKENVQRFTLDIRAGTHVGCSHLQHLLLWNKFEAQFRAVARIRKTYSLPIFGSRHSNHTQYNFIFLYFLWAQSVIRIAHASSSAVEARKDINANWKLEMFGLNQWWANVFGRGPKKKEKTSGGPM
jgi:hypothetical protein